MSLSIFDTLNAESSPVNYNYKDIQIGSVAELENALSGVIKLEANDKVSIENKEKPIKEIMRDILKIRAGMKADDVLREMQRRKIHLAILQGKDGKTLGIATMEDLIEEIFGEIVDEHDVK